MELAHQLYLILIHKLFAISSKQNIMSKTVEIKEYTDPDTGDTFKALYFNGEVFDWYIDKDELNKAKTFAKGNQVRNRAVVGDVIQFFMQCLREALGREISLKELNEAIRKGAIE